MDEPTAQATEPTLPELIRFMLEHMRGIQLKCPPTFQPEDYVNVWQYLAAAGNYLIDQIEDLRSKGLDQWETGDEASVQQFGRLSVPQGKKFLQTVIREMASLGTKSHVTSARAGIDTQPFDPNLVPRLVESEALVEGVRRENDETDDVKNEDFVKEAVENDVVKKEAVEPKVIKAEAVAPSPQEPVFASIERKSAPLYTLEPSTSLTTHSHQLVQVSHNASSSRLQNTSPRPILLAHHTTTSCRRHQQQRRPATPTPPIPQRPTLPILPLLHRLQLQRRLRPAFNVRFPNTYGRARGNASSTTARLSSSRPSSGYLARRARVHEQR